MSLEDWIYPLFLISLLLIVLLNRVIKNKVSLIFLNLVFISEASVLTYFFDKFPVYFSFPILILSAFFLYRLLNEFDLSIYSTNYSKKPNLPLFIQNYNLEIAFFLILSIVVYEFFADRFFSQADLLVLTLAFFLATYNYLSVEYNFMKDFFIVFLSINLIFFILPTILYMIINKEIGQSSEGWILDDEITNIMLVIPLAKILTILGFNVVGSGSFIYFENLESGIFQELSIAEGCSGIVSIQLFLSAFISYIYVLGYEFRIDVYLIIMLGVLMAYFSNLLRMAVIIIIGHYWGMEALQFTHQYLGWLFFTFWLFLFWSIFEYSNNKYGIVEVRPER